ncbi:hypothetical protein DNTS_024415 [Danionella cerebrum]|uniref:TGF-beta family profile domain-containing protein n=1 Tax=Danionella cerebrum TaxID=2873325 RepID=A0A553RL15_9TELE|nr:hypothetical protein DNTS_024415 [Danionella translucida]
MASGLVAARAFLCLSLVEVHLGLVSGLKGAGEADEMSVSMFRVYEKYSREHQLQEVNTVRSFRGVPERSHHKLVFNFNLASLPNSEAIVTSTLHFLNQQPRPWSCRRPRASTCLQHLHPVTTGHLMIRGTSLNAAAPSLLSNITLSPNRKGLWQTLEISSAIKRAHVKGELLITVEFGIYENHENESFTNFPFILVFADDSLINEPDSIVMSLQRYSPSQSNMQNGALLAPSRFRRGVDDVENSLQFNALKSRELWDGTYFEKTSKPLSKSHEHQEPPRRSQKLMFDEKTMKKARRKQWSEPRVCSRRYLRVDFQDIGWSEWILAPKAFDAYYCAGTCGFPMSKVVRPSNHATIQSIVRAVGITPGVPEPCCVPEEMSSLAVLFLDPNRNMIVKVYPSMSVETCACR